MANYLLFIYGLIIKLRECAVGKSLRTVLLKNLYRVFPEIMLNENTFPFLSTPTVMIKGFLERVEVICLKRRAECGKG